MESPGTGARGGKRTEEGRKDFFLKYKKTGDQWLGFQFFCLTLQLGMRINN